MKLRAAPLALLAIACLMSGCSGAGGSASQLTAEEKAKGLVLVTLMGKGGTHVFKAEAARTPAEQQRGLMFRTDLSDQSAMLFHPYPPEGGGPREASFWMKDTPTALDIIFIRADGTIARIGHGEPFDETPVSSGEPVAAILELKAGRAAALGIGEGDKASWPDAPS